MTLPAAPIRWCVQCGRDLPGRNEAMASDDKALNARQMALKLAQEKLDLQREKKALEQQLAQAHHDLEMLSEDVQNRDHHLFLAREENAAMRALLEVVAKGTLNFFTYEIMYDNEEVDVPALFEKLRAFLAKHPQK